MPFDIETYLNSLPLDTTCIDVSYKGLTYLPDLSRFKKLKRLYCNDNLITFLPELNNTIEVIDCKNNQLTELPELNNNLILIDCSNNKLTELPQLNHNLKQLDCYQNKITYLPPLNNKLKVLSCYNNKFYNNIKYFNIIKTLRNFRYTYYALKYKKHFKKWLWEKVREPKIMAKFHPSHLDALEDTDDLELFLEDWIKDDFIKN